MAFPKYSEQLDEILLTVERAFTYSRLRRTPSIVIKTNQYDIDFFSRRLQEEAKESNLFIIGSSEFGTFTKFQSPHGDITLELLKNEKD